MSPATERWRLATRRRRLGLDEGRVDSESGVATRTMRQGHSDSGSDEGRGDSDQATQTWPFAGGRGDSDEATQTGGTGVLGIRRELWAEDMRARRWLTSRISGMTRWA